MIHIKKDMKHNMRATGLLEVIVVLGIIAITMVGATQLTVQALVRVKQDEMVDYANGLLLETLEVAKSPDEVRLSSAFGTVTNPRGSYSLESDADGSLLFQRSTQISQKITACNAGSDYEVDIDPNVAIGLPRLCVQVLIERIDNNGAVDYQLTSRYVLNLGADKETRIAELVGYRKGDFQLL